MFVGHAGIFEVRRSSVALIVMTLQFPEARPHIQREPSPGTVADIVGPHNHRHYKILLHLHAGAVRFRMR